MTHDLGIVYENETALVQEFEIETKPYGCHSDFVVRHKILPSIAKTFSESDGRNAKELAIDYCDSYVRQVVD